MSSGCVGWSVVYVVGVRTCWREEIACRHHHHTHPHPAVSTRRLIAAVSRHHKCAGWTSQTRQLCESRNHPTISCGEGRFPRGICFCVQASTLTTRWARPGMLRWNPRPSQAKWIPRRTGRNTVAIITLSSYLFSPFCLLVSLHVAGVDLNLPSLTY